MACYQCGSCCRGFINLIPKTKDSNLHPKFLENLGDEVYNYLDKHCEPMGKKCKWLKQDNCHSSATCSVYEHRGSTCRDYDFEFCNVGLGYWKQVQKEGFEIPKEILSQLIKHPLWGTGE